MQDELEPLVQKENQSQSSSSASSHCWEVTGCDRSELLACPAHKQNKNCYEMDRVPCCTKSRFNCSNCSVYMALTRPTHKVMIHVSTLRMDIEGFVHVPLKMRLSDFMNREEPAFIAVTDAKIRQPGESGPVTKNEVAVVNKSQIIAAWSIEDWESQRRAA